jgi:hypothetical protein
MLSKPTPTADGSDLDSDLKLLLTSVEPTFMSRNPSVVLAATKVFYYLAPRSDWKKVITPLLRLLAVSKEVERVVIRYLVVLTSRQRTISVSLISLPKAGADHLTDAACTTLHLIPLAVRK